MSSLRRLSFAVLAGAFWLFTGCTQPRRPAHADADTKPEGARMSTTEAVRIAKRAAERQGVHLSDFKEPKAHFELARKDQSWFVFFDGRVPMPGNHFAVSIDDQTGDTYFIPGK